MRPLPLPPPPACQETPSRNFRISIWAFPEKKLNCSSLLAAWVFLTAHSAATLEQSFTAILCDGTSDGESLELALLPIAIALPETDRGERRDSHLPSSCADRDR